MFTLNPLSNGKDDHIRVWFLLKFHVIFFFVSHFSERISQMPFIIFISGLLSPPPQCLNPNLYYLCQDYLLIASHVVKKKFLLC